MALASGLPDARTAAWRLLSRQCQVSAFPPCLRPLWSRPFRVSLPWATHQPQPVPHGSCHGVTELTHEGSPCAAASQPSSLTPHLRCPSARPFALNTWENSPPPPAPGSDWYSLGSASRGGWHPPHQALPPLPPTHCLCPKPHRTLTLSGLHSCASRQVLILSHLRRETRAWAVQPGLQPPHVGGSGGWPRPGRPTLAGQTPKALLGVTPQLPPTHSVLHTHRTGGLSLPPRASYQEEPWISRRAGLSLTSLPGPPPPPAIITAAGASAWEAGRQARAGAPRACPPPPSPSTGPAPGQGSKRGHCSQQVAV